MNELWIGLFWECNVLGSYWSSIFIVSSSVSWLIWLFHLVGWSHSSQFQSWPDSQDFTLYRKFHTFTALISCFANSLSVLASNTSEHKKVRPTELAGECQAWLYVYTPLSSVTYYLDWGKRNYALTTCWYCLALVLWYPACHGMLICLVELGCSCVHSSWTGTPILTLRVSQPGT